MKILIAIALGVYIFYGLYLIYVTLRVAKDNGKLEAMPIYAKVVAYSYLVLAVILDFIFNLIIGSLIFLELPREFMFTDRCSRHMHEMGRRGRIARWFCNSWLNPFDENHCH